MRGRDSDNASNRSVRMCVCVSVWLCVGGRILIRHPWWRHAGRGSVQQREEHGQKRTPFCVAVVFRTFLLAHREPSSTEIYLPFYTRTAQSEEKLSRLRTRCSVWGDVSSEEKMSHLRTTCPVWGQAVPSEDKMAMIPAVDSCFLYYLFPSLLTLLYIYTFI